MTGGAEVALTIEVSIFTPGPSAESEAWRRLSRSASLLDVRLDAPARFLWSDVDPADGTTNLTKRWVTVFAPATVFG